MTRLAPSSQRPSRREERMSDLDAIAGSRSRRDFLRLAAASALTTMAGAPYAGAATKNLTFLHDSSFIAAFDQYFQKTLAPAYEKEAGIKLQYELTSVGTLQTRLTAVLETGSGA